MTKSYDIGGTLADNPRDAIIAILGDFIYAGGLNSAETVSTFNPEEIAEEWLDSLEDGIPEARIVGQFTENGDPAYERIGVTLEVVTDLASEIIRDAI